jgi:carbonic anhydrase/acetyltransferase-like protein (isoleucine patch superfamily)
MSLTAFGDKVPVFGRDAFVHPDTTVIGDVVVEDGASIWPGAVLRGDLERIVIGAHTSLQDNSVAHTDAGYPLTVGPDCVIGHAVIIHGATIGARCLIGMGSTLLNGCVIGEDSIIGANALVTQGKVFPPRSLIVGSPAKLVREVTDEDLAVRASLREMYVERSRRYAELGLGADLTAFRR